MAGITSGQVRRKGRSLNKAKQQPGNAEGPGGLPEGGKRFFSQAPGTEKKIGLRPCQQFAIIKKLGGNLKLLCGIARVSRAGYYKWLKGQGKQPKDYEDYLLVKKIFDQGKGKWGWRTIQMHLKDDYGIIMNHKKIERIKNDYGLITKIRRKNPYKAMLKKTLEHRVYPNILNRQFRQTQPKTVFCTDITYLPFSDKLTYLSAVKDIASREIVGWSMSQNIQMDLVLNTLDNLKQNMPGKEVLLHSDQGSHYTSPDFALKAKALNLIQSMSRKGNCTDNGPMESFFGHFKDEVDFKDCKTFAELEELTAAYMDYYNTKRKQWNLNKMTPEQYRQYLIEKSG